MNVDALKSVIDACTEQREDRDPQWAAFVVDFETMMRTNDADERRGRREHLEEHWIIPLLVESACIETDAVSEFREFVVERAEEWAGRIMSPSELANWLDRTYGHGFYERVRTDYAEHLAEKQQASDARDEAYRQADPRLANATAMRAVDTAAIRAVYNWNAVHRQILLLLGPKGIGKSVAACHYFYAVAKLRWPPVFVRAAEFARMSKFDGERDYVLDAQHLILDDLGVEYDAKGSVASDFDELIDRFYSDPDRRLIITSNLLPDEFAARFGVRVIDRLRERGEIAVLAGSSLREGK